MNMDGHDRGGESRKGAKARREVSPSADLGSTSLRLGARFPRSGFSLIEVTLALVVVGLGLLAVFHLFPTGLRAGIDATAETRCAQFADEVFNQVYAEAAVRTNTATFLELFEGPDDEVDIDLSGDVRLNGSGSLQYPANADSGYEEYVRYRCEAGVDDDDRRASVELRVSYGRAGGFTNVFYADVYNFGM